MATGPFRTCFFTYRIWFRELDLEYLKKGLLIILPRVIFIWCYDPKKQSREYRAFGVYHIHYTKSWLGWFTAYLANIFLTKLYGQISRKVEQWRTSYGSSLSTSSRTILDGPAFNIVTMYPFLYSSTKLGLFTEEIHYNHGCYIKQQHFYRAL